MLSKKKSDIGKKVSLDKYFDRELSWLEFNRRVVNEAADDRTPLLERVRFLSIFSSNLDEFVMKRIGFLKDRLIKKAVFTSGLSPHLLLSAAKKLIFELLDWQDKIYTQQVVPALKKQGIQIYLYTELSQIRKEQIDEYFRSEIYPVLTPLAVDPGHPFPFISNLSTSLGITLRHPDRRGKLFSRLKVPEVLPALIRLHSEGSKDKGLYNYIPLIALIRNNLDELYPGMVVRNVMAFRITRTAEIERGEEGSEDLLGVISEELRQRRFGRVVRLEHEPNPIGWMLDYLTEELELTEKDLYKRNKLLDYTWLNQIADLPIAKLRYSTWKPLPLKALADSQRDIFSLIRRRDILVHHPFDSFEASVERFVTSAADDPNVVAIKICLYRTSDDSPFIPALLRAAEAGKQVVAIVELKARFDEHRNIRLAQALEEAGAHVVYGIVGYKTHTKTTLVVRHEPDGLRCYAHIGTGNYHIHTSRLYTDLGLLTCKKDVTDDLTDLFVFLTGRSLKRSYRHLLVAPFNMKEEFIRMIENEKKNQKEGLPARIIAKMNSLQDRDIIEALYSASKAGVKIDLIVRGVCCLKPQVKNLSENIRVISVIGRFLEHSRIFHFADGKEKFTSGKIFIGSADWMYRNLHGRVELVTPVEANVAKETIERIININLADHRHAWEMQPDGSYVQRNRGKMLALTLEMEPTWP
jgi:polyphosphate kinase